MMTREEHLLVHVMEECSEVAQCVSKALRFGLLDRRPNQELSNRMRIRQELTDLIVVITLLDPALLLYSADEFAAKIDKVERYLKYAEGRGRLT